MIDTIHRSLHGLLAPILRAILVGIAVLSVAACGGGGGGGAGGDGGNAGTQLGDVTLSGSMAEPVTTLNSSMTSGIQPQAITYADYILYCVTFTNPTSSGSGTFDSSGSFALTIPQAAGKPLGCFINNAATNAVVTTLTFTSGGAPNGSPGFGEGGNVLAIQFDPLTGTATAEVPAGTTPAVGGPSLTPEQLAGTWAIFCGNEQTGNTPEETADCDASFGSGIQLFFDVVRWNDDGTIKHAMGVWPSKNDFTDAGSTEGFVAVGPLVTDVESLTVPTANVRGVFDGFTHPANGYDYTLNAIAPDDAFDFLKANYLDHFDPAGTHGFDTKNPGQTCTGASLPIAGTWTDSAAARLCLVAYIEYARLGNVFFGDVVQVGAGMPALDSARNRDQDTGFIGGATPDTMIRFIPALGEDNGGPIVPSRMDLMAIRTNGESVTPFSQWSQRWKQDNGSGTEIDCGASGSLSINVTSTTEDGGLVAWWTQTGVFNCGAVEQRIANNFKVYLEPVDSDTAPLPPGLLTPAVLTDGVQLEWTSSVGATSYNLYHSTTAGVTTATGTKVTGVTSPYVHAGTPGQTYYYVVTAVNAVGESEPSNEQSATVINPPVANAGPDQSVAIGTMVTLDGSASTDPDGSGLSFSWVLISTPSGSGVTTIVGPTDVMPTFTPDVPGDYVVRLSVINTSGHPSTPDDVTITATGTPNIDPTADAGPDQNVTGLTLITLDGSSSNDPDGGPSALTFQWVQINAPDGSSISTASLSDPFAVQPTFTPDVTGLYIWGLIVSDGSATNGPDTVEIFVSP